VIAQVINRKPVSWRSIGGGEKIVEAGILLCALLVVLYCGWALDRGLDITDESYYLLLAIYPESVKMYISAQQWITGGIWQVTGSLVAFRAAGLTLLVGGSSLMGFGAIVAVSHSKLKLSNNASGRALVVLASSIICALLYAQTINFSPSYNLLASFGAYVAAGLVFLALYSGDKWVRHGLFILVGCALSVEFVSKPSSGFATLCLIATWIFFLNPSLTSKTTGFAIVLISLIFNVYTLAIVNTTILDAKTSITYGFELFRMVQDEAIGARLGRYIYEFWRNFIHGCRDHLYLILAVAMYLVARRALLVVVVFGILTYTLFYTKYHLGYSGQYELQFIPQMEFAFVLLLLILAVSMTVWKNNQQFMLIAGGLIFLPYSVSVGTGNSIFTQIIGCLAPWGAAVALISNLHYVKKSDKAMVFTLLSGFIFAFSLQIMAGMYRAPYHIVQPMKEQVYSIDVGVLGSVKVDVETRNFIGALRTAAENCQIVPGSPFFGMYNVPGIALVLHAIPVVTPWLNNLSQADAVLKFGASDAVSSSVAALLLDVDGNNPLLPETLGFPMNFQYCGSATFPLLIQEVQIWKHK
jgi:hypothetical protein